MGNSESETNSQSARDDCERIMVVSKNAALAKCTTPEHAKTVIRSVKFSW